MPTVPQLNWNNLKPDLPVKPRGEYCYPPRRVKHLTSHGVKWMTPQMAQQYTDLRFLPQVKMLMDIDPDD